MLSGCWDSDNYLRVQNNPVFPVPHQRIDVYLTACFADYRGKL